jgi:hypothetical protein
MAVFKYLNWEKKRVEKMSDFEFADRRDRLADLDFAAGRQSGGRAKGCGNSDCQDL